MIEICLYVLICELLSTQWAVLANKAENGVNMIIKDWLEQQGAVCDEGGLLRFNDATAAWQGLEAGAVLAPLTGFVVLEIDGVDAEPFLQGQLSNDIRELENGCAQYSTYSTAKGRMLANFLIWKEKEIYSLLLPLGLVDSIVKRLRMFVMRSKVCIKIADYVPALLSGPLASEVLGKIGLPAPEGRMEQSAIPDGMVVNLPFAGYLLVQKMDTTLQLWQKLRHYSALGGSGIVDLIFIRSGFAWVLVPTQEAFVPQMANMELVSAINFRKGCYPGQEIVARMQYLGKSKRRLYRIVTEGASLLVGDGVFVKEAPDQSVGTIAAVATLENGKQEALVVMLISAWEGEVCAGKSAALLQLLSLPYVVTDKT
ncbi:MAG: YgfZ/GcvT domain-containing protein [Craterilacuibacter sp.]